MRPEYKKILATDYVATEALELKLNGAPVLIKKGEKIPIGPDGLSAPSVAFLIARGKVTEAKAAKESSK